MRLSAVAFLGLIALLGSWSRAEAQDEPNVRQLLRQLKEMDIARRQAAVRDLNQLGPQHKAAVPVLMESLTDKEEHVRQTVAGSLAKIGGPAVPALLQALEAPDKLRRCQACLVLAHIGPEARSAVPALGKLMQDRETNCRAFAALALVRIDPDNQVKTVELLASLLKDQDRGVRIATVHALELLSRKAEGVMPALATALQDPAPEVRIATCAVLSRMGPDAKDALPALQACRKGEDYQVRVSATAAAIAIDPELSPKVVPDLVEILDDKNPEARRGAVYLLGQIGTPAKTALPALQRLLQDENRDVRLAAEQAIKRITTKGE